MVHSADAIATVDESGEHWALALINRHPDKTLACMIQFGQQPLQGKHLAFVLSLDPPEAFNSIEHPMRVIAQRMELEFQEEGSPELLPHSLTILKVHAKDLATK
jgi:hypothetical protein